MLGERSFDELKCLKRELKCWESMFERKHSRKPNKDDVNNAPEEIKETYIKYKNLKKNTEKLPDTPRQEKDDEVFGKGLNKSKDTSSVNRSVRIQMSPGDYKPIRLRHGQRPKKLNKDMEKHCDETSQNSRKPEADTLSNPVPVMDTNMACKEDTRDDNDLGFSITSKKQECWSKPGLMFGKSEITQRMKRRSAITSDWLEKHKPELIENNSTEQSTTAENYPDDIRKVQDMIPSDDTFKTGISDPCYTSSEHGDTSVASKAPQKDKNAALQKLTGNDSTESTGLPGKKKTTDLPSPNYNSSVETIPGTLRDSIKDVAEVEGSRSFEDTTNHQRTTFAPSVGRFPTFPVDGASESGGKIQDEFSVDKSNVQGRANNVSTAKRKRTALVDEEESTGNASLEEINQKQSKIRKTQSDENNDDSSKKDEVTERPVVKRSSGLVSENFRALNMKVPRYCRRRGGTNYGAYKRKLWKQKQQEKEQGEKKTHWKKSTTKARSAKTTTTVCFKCGTDGHWAKDCPRNKNQIAIKTENWSEPVKAPADLDIGDEEWQATESKLEFLQTERLPRPHSTPSNTPPAIEPLYEPENGKPVSTPQEVYKALKKLGFDSFRPGQEGAIMQILCGLSTLVVLSTGAGKSLCYQLPAYMYSKRSPCLTLVISPLVSLMEDQVVGLPFGLCGVSLNTNMTKVQRQKAVDQISSGKAAVVLVSPEALVGGSTGPGCLPHVSKLPPIAFACIDEAHCLSEWSHNFRPSYLRVCKVLRERFGVRCFLGLTATATKSTAISVAEHLGITQRPDAIIRGATIPPNLNLSVSCDLNRDRAVLELLQGSRFSDCDSIIIYCTRREQTDRLATFLRTCLQKNPLNTSSCIGEQNVEEEEVEEKTKGKKRGRKRKSGSGTSSAKKSASWQAECYHAGMSAAQRRKVQKKFMSGELRIVVATVAFGMGLDKANVRAIIHYNIPKSFESYVQEIGRAGRDGLPSHCHVFIDPEGKDVRELRRHAHASTVDRNTIKKLVSKIFPKCDCKTLEENMKNRQRELSLRRLEKSETAGKRGELLNAEKLGDPEGDYADFEFDDDDQILDHVLKVETSRNMQIVKEGETPGNIADEQGVIHGAKTGLDVSDGERSEGQPATQSVATTNVEAPLEREDGSTDCNSAISERLRVCGGHEVALPIEKAVQALDMKEEGIATLLCYLELHGNKWVQILQPVRSTCTLKFYGGPAHLHFVAQRVPVVTAAVAYAREQQEFERNTSSLTFPVVEIVDKMGWDLEPARRELYALQWNDSLRLAGESGLSAGHSGIIVEFTDLAFHLRAPGDLDDDERDEVCDFLEDRIVAQERSQLSQLHGVWSMFNTRAHPNCWQSSEECDKKVDEELKSVVKAYFELEKDPTKTELNTLSEARKKCQFVESNIPIDEPVNWDSVARDIRSFLNLHGDSDPSGRAIARIFHGIDSPCFPASVWGRDRRFWRRHLDVDFNLLRKFAIKELVKYR